MKALDVILKVVVALAAVAGLVFVVIKYGDQIVAWFKGLFCQKTPCVVDSETVQEEASAEDAPVEEAPAEEAAAPNQASEEDFENC